MVIAQSVETIGLPPIILGYLVAVFIRVSQGSGMVAMITAAGIVSPLLAVSPVSEMQRALVVLAIAAGSVAASHVNDSGFWLVCKYLNMTEGQTLKTWTFITAFLSLFPGSGNPAQFNNTVKAHVRFFYDKKSPAADCGKPAAGDFPFHGSNTAQPSNPAVLHLGNALVYSSHDD
ncbi:MAG: hypothetical protein ACLTW9_29530 [Enterocloster sp.]